MQNLFFLTIMAAIFATTTASAVEPMTKCAAAKLKLAGKYSACRFNAEAKSVTSGESIDYSKCDSTFSSKFSDVEADADGECAAEGNQVEVMTAVQDDEMEVSCRLDGGTVVGGACWYLGDFGLTCNSVCFWAGRNYDEATNTYAGADGTLDNCQVVLDALGQPPASPCQTDDNYTATYNETAVDKHSFAGYGCSWSITESCPSNNEYEYAATRIITAPTAANVSFTFNARACACKRR